MDAYQELRSLPLQAIIHWLGIREDWKIRKGGTEFYGRCPLHEAKRNNTSFSFDQEGKFHCFSCQAKGKGCIDFVMAYHKVGFQAAVEWLKNIDVQTVDTSTKRVQEPPATGHITENQPFKGSYNKYFVPSEWLVKRGFSQETLDYFGVGQYDNPKRQSAYKGKILLPVRRFKDGELVGYLARDTRPAEERGTLPNTSSRKALRNISRSSAPSNSKKKRPCGSPTLSSRRSA